MYTSKWTEAICAMPRRRSLHKSCLYCRGGVRNNKGDNVLRLLKSSVATGTMHAGRKQRSGVSGYAMRRWPGRNNVKSGMGKIEPSKVPHPLLRTAFPLYGPAHIKGKSLYMIAAPRWRQTSAHERCYPLRPQGLKSGASWQTTTLNSSVKPTKPSHFVIPTYTMRQFYKITSYDPLFDLFLSFLFVESKHGNVDNCHFPFCSNASTQFGYCALTSRPLFSISHYHHLMSIARLRLCPACVSCPCSAIHHFRISLFRLFFVRAKLCMR